MKSRIKRHMMTGKLFQSFPVILRGEGAEAKDGRHGRHPKNAKEYSEHELREAILSDGESNPGLPRFAT